MNKEEQIALELMKLSTQWFDKIKATTADDVVDTYTSIYLGFKDKLEKIKKEENEVMKLQDEIGTYRYILDNIKRLIDSDENNFVLKEEIVNLMGGLYD